MGNQAIWTAAHMGIPMIVVIANNRVYMNDVAHQERMAVIRGRPVENKYVGQRIDEPAPDLTGIARAQGWQGERVDNAGDLAAALLRAEAVWRDGKPYFIEALIDPNLEQGRGGHTEGRKEA
jgi:thiamine pyrophosphate-dependent acetolactate synthase large subunit-like protein